MKIVHPSAKGFAKSIEVLWNIVDQGLFKFSKKGINLIAMDPGQISMVTFYMPAEVFLTYEIDEERNLGLDIDYIKKILKRAKANELLELLYADSQLTFAFTTDKRRREFKAPLLDLTEGYNREPAIEYSNSLKITADALKDLVDDASIVSNYIKFILVQDQFVAEAKSETGHVREKYDVGDDVLEINAETGATVLYPIEYLQDILKATRRGDPLTLYMETAKPLKMEFNMEGAHIKYYLAPAEE